MTTNNSNADTPFKGASPPTPGQRKWSNLFKVLKVGITLVIFGFIVHSVDLSAAWAHVAHQNLPLVALTAVVMATQIGLGGTRWWLIYRRAGRAGRRPRARRRPRLSIAEPRATTNDARDALVSRTGNPVHEIGWDRGAWRGATTRNSRSYCEEEQRCQAA
jgi:hypothetical protein